MQEFQKIKLCIDTSVNSKHIRIHLPDFKNFFILTPIEACDYVLVPNVWMDTEDNSHIEELTKHAAALGKKVLVFWITDSDFSLPLKNCIVFKTSLLKSKQLANEYVYPALFNDPLEIYYKNNFLIRKKTEKPPVVGFCGNIKNLTKSTRAGRAIESLRRTITELFVNSHTLYNLLSSLKINITKHPGRYKGRKIRSQVFKSFKNSLGITTNFIFRERYYDGLDHLPSDHPKVASIQKTFYDNIQQSDYILCPRGGGNYSIRFYETLAMGRIPIFINTDCTLPFDWIIDWKKYCIWVEESQINNLPGIIKNYHNSISSSNFEKQQQTCRELWLEWLSYEGYAKNFHKHFSKCDQPLTDSQSILKEALANSGQ